MSNLQQAQESINSMFEVFARHRRRYALRELRRHANPMELVDLADEIAVRENETLITDIPADEVKRIYMSLSHTHIPKLEEEDLVLYDQEQDSVTLAEQANHIEQHQDFLTIN
ncbi:hypothetical protein HYG81_03730 [Natrinema zhouii]|uniref:DUF7344 domain-containing protein n=1 Tax=Natrinema zhouii TaxID=1710539 RepID=A0A7D6GL10_9EURY|nr:hypothetical protein [Natrinema zhouii]QLK26739.1 hypothetical protein HYG81_03730 [Natrinema zhouii]